MGATETVEWEHSDNLLVLIEELKSNDIDVFAVEQVENSISLETFSPQRKTALIFGNEVFGVAQEAIKQCHGSIEIPQLGTKHSLNISVTTGIVIWDLFCKLNFR